MNLAAKFNLVLAVIFSIGLVLTSLLMYTIVQKNAREEVVYRAGLMMQAALAMRSYTINEIAPLLRPHMTDTFLPQTVPAYAATEAFENLRQSQPDYTYKEATLNPTNPRDRATDWETDIISVFRNNPQETEIVGTRSTPTGTSLYLARPIQITNPDCLVCHSTPDVAPVSLITQYGDANGFGWQLNEVVGAQIVSVPTAVPQQKARETLYTVVGLLLAGFIVIAIALNILLRRIVVAPAVAMAGIANEISKGKLNAPQLDADGKDEMATLAGAFNRMRRSLEKAMKMIEKQMG